MAEKGREPTPALPLSFVALDAELHARDISKVISRITQKGLASPGLHLGGRTRPGRY